LQDQGREIVEAVHGGMGDGLVPGRQRPVRCTFIRALQAVSLALLDNYRVGGRPGG
jgi:hypothetical protein